MRRSHFVVLRFRVVVREVFSPFLRNNGGFIIGAGNCLNVVQRVEQQDGDELYFLAGVASRRDEVLDEGLRQTIAWWQAGAR